MKTFKLLLCLFSLCLGLNIMTACEKEPPQNPVSEINPSSESPVEPTQYEQLNNNEKLIYDSLIININSFHSPSSLRILEIGTYAVVNDEFITDEIVSRDLDDQDHCYLKVQATTKTGKINNKWIKLYLKDYNSESQSYKKGYFFEPSLYAGLDLPIFSTKLSEESASAANINKALIEHWEEMGLL